jgi:hypothetical protein
MLPDRRSLRIGSETTQADVEAVPDVGVRTGLRRPQPTARPLGASALPLVLARSLGTRSLRVSALRFQRGSCRPRKPASRVFAGISGRLASSSGAMARVTRPHSCPTTCWKCGSETKRERQAESAQATQKWGCLALAIAERPATPDPRIRTIVRSLIQEATSAVRPKMIAGRAWRPTWPSIDPRTQRCRSHVHGQGRRWGRARRKRQGEH